MQERSFELKFLTPAFLGDAEQKGVWRTPPIKALLRQWWRVAYAAEQQFRQGFEADMRHEEGIIFGHAWLDDDLNAKGEKVAARQSQVRLRLDAWTPGSQQGVSPLATTLPTSYAWFGLVNRGNGLPDRTGIKAAPDRESVKVLRIAVPDDFEKQLNEVISLINAFGTLGSRRHGGWGSLYIKESLPVPLNKMAKYARPLQTCLKNDWPMSLVDYEGFCVWHSDRSFHNWNDVMKFVASIRKDVRSCLKTIDGKDLRSALGFASPGCMASQLRWKVFPEEDVLKLRVFAMPHCIPEDGGININSTDLQSAWKAVFASLDQQANLQRVKE